MSTCEARWVDWLLWAVIPPRSSGVDGAQVCMTFNTNAYLLLEHEVRQALAVNEITFRLELRRM